MTTSKRLPLALLISCCTLWTLDSVAADPAPSAARAPAVNVSNSLSDNLGMLRGQRVTLSLLGGKDIEGAVGDVGNDLVQVRTLAGREFYDALVRISSITSVTYRARDK